MTKNTPFLQTAKRKREDLYLPILYFPVADPLATTNWIDTLGEKAFCGWLKLQTLANRSKNKPEVDYSRIPQSLEELAKTLNMSKSTLYRSIIKPLWNYGLIDLLEFSERRKIGFKPMNIVVYPYPQNLKQLENQPLRKIRDYDTQYISIGKTIGSLGGRPAVEEIVLPTKEKSQPSFSFETVNGIRVLRTNRIKSNRFKSETVIDSEMKPSNIQKDLNKQKDKVIKNNGRKLKFDDDDLANANLLLELMQRNLALSFTPNKEKSANEFRVLKEKYKHDDRTIKFIIEWSQKDPFWLKNIRSAKTFKEKYETLYLAAKESVAKKQGYASSSQKEQVGEIIEKFKREAEMNKQTPQLETKQNSHDNYEEMKRKIENGEI